MKLQNSKDKEKILKTTREKAQITYSETIVTLIAIMLSATIKAERLKISIKMLKYVNLEFYTPGNFSKCENRIKTFLKKAAAAAAKSLQSCLTLCNRIDGSPPAPLSLGFSRQEYWSRLPFPSPMQESEK